MCGEILPWSDNWYIEGDNAWFCAENIGAVFCVDLNSQQCELVAWIPDYVETSFRECPYCMKQGDNIICLPSRGRYIWYFNTKQKIWDKIEMDHSFPVFVYMDAYRLCDSDRVWLEEGNSGKIYEFSLWGKRIEREYQIPQFGNLFWGQYTVVGEKLYCVSGDRICTINISSGNIDVYTVSGVKAELYTICYDGLNFWLSGHCKEIYVWNQAQGTVKIINEFPNTFGIYHFKEKKTCLVDYDSFYVGGDNFFIASISIGEWVWFIPDQASEIMYINKKTYEICMLKIEEEIETLESIVERSMYSKYFVQYVREGRYIGLYSFKNNLIFEIDTNELCVNRTEYLLNNMSIEMIINKYYVDNRVLFEGSKRDVMLFGAMLKKEKKENGQKKELTSTVGRLIQHNLNL